MISKSIYWPLQLLAIRATFLFAATFISCSQENKKTEDNAAAISQENLKTTTLPIEGMTCGACVSRVKKTLLSIEGIQNVEVSLEKRNVNVSYDDTKLSPDSMTNAINDLGYKAGTPK